MSEVPGIAWDGEDGDYVKFKVAPGTWKFLGIGVLPVSSPKPAPVVLPSKDLALPKKSWSATASVPNGMFPLSGAKIPIDVSAGNAIDGDHWTGWRDMTRTQYPGQWFQVDMQQKNDFNGIVIDNTWAQWDSPSGFSLTVSDDGEKWSEPIATGSGAPGMTLIRFPMQHSRYLRITQTGASDKYHWSVYELDVFKE